MSLPEAMADQLLPVLDRLVQVLNERQVSYALIGGLAVAFHGPIRATRDIDLLVSIPQLELPAVLDALAAGGFTLDPAEAIRVWNRDHLLDFASGSVRVDWLKPVLPAFAHILARARWEQIGERRIRVADAEGLLLLKLIAFRPRDQEDIKGILAAKSGALDLDWVRRECLQLVGDADPRIRQFEALVREFYAPLEA
jgi:predicted nucleotidyltransferase